MKLKKIATATVAATLSFSSLAYDVSSMNWDEIVKEAKSEGEVSFAVWYLTPEWRTLVKDFTSETGIKIKVPEGQQAGIENKLLAEQRREVSSLDVVAIGSSKFKRFDSENMFIKLENIPEYPNLSTKLEGVETNGYGVAFWGNQTGLAYDSAKISTEDLPQSFDDLVDYFFKHPKEFGLNDPNNGGSGDRFVQSVINSINGEIPMDKREVLDQDIVDSWSKTWDWFNGHLDNITITASNADSLTRMNDGEIAIAPAWEDHLSGLQRSGAITKRIKFYIPEFGMPGGGNFVVIPKNAKHKAASLVFLNWLTSAKTQEKLNERFGSAPVNSKSQAKHALVAQEERSKRIDSLPDEYSIEAKKNFTNKVLMK